MLFRFRLIIVCCLTASLSAPWTNEAGALIGSNNEVEFSSPPLDG